MQTERLRWSAAGILLSPLSVAAPRERLQFLRRFSAPVHMVQVRCHRRRADGASLIGLTALLLVALVLVPGLAFGQGYAEEPQAIVKPHASRLALAAGERGTRTITIYNNGDGPLHYAFRGYGAQQDRGQQVGNSYIWTFSDEPGGPVFDWLDITALGTRLDLGLNEAAAVALPFTFPFFGVGERQVYVSSNGFLTFGPHQAGQQFHTDVPNLQPPNAIISPLWTAFSTNAGGTIHTYYNAERRCFVVQYTEVPVLSRGSGILQRFTFQALLYHDGTILFQYLDVKAVAATVGVENEQGTEGLRLAFDEAFVRNEFAVRLTPHPAYLQLTPAAGIIGPGRVAEVTVDLDARSLTPGIYRHLLQLHTSDPRNALVPLDVQLDVGSEAFPFRVTPGTLEVSAGQGEQVTQSLSIENLDASEAQHFRLIVQGSRVAPNTAMREKKETVYAPPSMGFSTNARGDHAFVSLDVQAPPALHVLAPSPVSYAGDFLYGDDARFAIITHDDNLFQTVEVETGHRTVHGTALPGEPGEQWTGLASDPTDGTLYGCTVHGNKESYLYRLDPGNGNATRLGRIAGASVVAGIAIDAQGQLYGVETEGDALVRIDKRSGVATVVGPLGFDANFDQGLDVDLATGTLYMTAFDAPTFEAQFRVVNMQTGSATLVAPFGEGVHLGYLALPSGSFVSSDVTTGSVIPAGRLDVPFALDARHLLAGVYEASVRIEATDRAGAPSMLLPVRLTVRGDPRIETPKPASVPFSEVYVGDFKDRTLLLANRGFDVLEVRNVRFDHPAFSLAPASEASLPLQLAPGVQQSLAVRFTPTQAGVVEALAFVESNDPATPSLVIDLTGRALSPPVITVEPEQGALVAAAGRTNTRTLTLGNVGGSALAYVAEVHAQDLLDGVVPPLLGEEFENGLPPGWSVIDNAGSGIVWMSHSAHANDYDNYTGGSGEALMASSHAKPGMAFDTEVRTPSLEANASNLTLAFRLNFVEASASLSLDLSRDGGDTWTLLEQWIEDAGETFAGPGRNVVVDLGPYLDEGDAFMLRWRYHSALVHPRDFYAQIDAVHLGASVQALTIDPASGTVSAGATQDMTLALDADGLQPGTYEAAVTVRHASGSPVVSPIVVPLTVTIISGAIVQIETAEAHPNEAFRVPLRIIGPLDDLRNFAFDLTYDPSLLELLDLDTDDTISDGAILELDAAPPGRLHVATVMPLRAPTVAEETLLFLHFRAKERIGETPLAFTAFTLNDGTLPTMAQPGRVVVTPLFGDVTLDLTIDRVDIARVRTYTAHYTTLSAAALAAADVTGDSRVDLADAAAIEAYLDGTLPCFPADLGCEGSGATLRYGTSQASAHAESSDAPGHVELGSNYPNPSNPSTTIPYALPEAAHVRVVVYNMLGQPVRVLVEGEQPAGRHTARWDGRNEAGGPVASGVYIYRLEVDGLGNGSVGSLVQTRRLTLVK